MRGEGRNPHGKQRAEPRALVVEDDPSWQQILGEILGDEGLAVDTAANAEQALAALRTSPHRLAVVDLSLGEGEHHNREGLAVLDAVRRLDPGCTALLLTGYATVELAVSALTEHGAFTCLRKETFRRRAFRELVQRALGAATAVPGMAPDEPETPAPAVEADQVVADQGTALLVEDDAGWRSILHELLREVGYKVRACASFGEARGYLRRGGLALAVVDLSLASSLAPEDNLDGLRLLDSTRAARLPTVVVSGVATPEAIECAYSEHGVFACLEKQAFDRRAFLRTVAEARASVAEGGELATLTDRELQVLELLARGRTNKDIGEALTITPNTVKRHLKVVFEKLGVHTRAAAAARAISLGMPKDG